MFLFRQYIDAHTVTFEPIVDMDLGQFAVAVIGKMSLMRNGHDYLSRFV